MRALRSLLPLVALATGCASAGNTLSRSYDRPGLAEVPLESLEVVISVLGPPVASPPVLNVPTFEAPGWDSVLKTQTEDPTTRDALAAALHKRLRAAGYSVMVRHSGQAEALPTTTAAPVQTSTVAPGGLQGMGLTATSSTAPAAVPAPPASPIEGAVLRQGQTLREVLDESKADGVLVVRVVPVDSFYIYEPEGQQLLDDASLGTLTAQSGAEGRSELRSGRLLVGQAFLFDRRTGLRLWSRQLPGFPEDGRLRAETKLLDFGHVTGKGERELMPEPKAAAASTRFAKAMFEGFGDARKGDSGARAALAEVDAEREQSKQSELDEGHFILAVDLSWAIESTSVNVFLDGEQIDSLGSGAIAPSGVLRLRPQIGYQWPGGFTLMVAPVFGFTPNSFSRTYHRDNPDPSLLDPTDTGAVVSLGSATLGGLEVIGGTRFELSRQFILRAGIGPYFEVWSLDTDSGQFLEGTTLYRLGLVGSLNLQYQTEAGFFVGPSLRGRLGYDTMGSVLGGFDLALSTGWQF